MNEKKMEWIKNYIRLNAENKNKKMILDDSGRLREDSVVISCSEYHLKVATIDRWSICIKSLCIFEGASDYHIDKEYFNMEKFNI